MQAFGYSTETMQFMLLPLVHEKRDPVGSMGNDSALAVLSDQPRMLYDYFKQLFAQVTNPPIDSIREEVIMSLECYVGPERNLLATTEQHAHRLMLPHPILTNEELGALVDIDHRGWKSKLIDITYDRAEGEAGLANRLERICREAEQAIEKGYSLLVLSDRGVSSERVPVSSLLAVGAGSEGLAQAVKETDFGSFLDGKYSVFGDTARLVSHFGVYVGEQFSALLKEQVKRYSGDANLTLGGLKEKAAAQPGKFRELFVVASNVTRQTPEVLCAENHPEMPVWQAVRTSMSIPLLFEAVRVREHVYVDGGLDAVARPDRF